MTELLCLPGGDLSLRYRFVWNYGTEVVYGGMTRADIEEIVEHLEKMTKFLSEPIYLLMVEELPEAEA
jgi:(2Fe-2S) ferredoxin